MIEEQAISDTTPNARPLEGMKILELGQILAGAFTTTMLGYFGAEVIKVEPPGEGDPIRNWRTVKDGTSLWWWSLARNKQSITINLKLREGQQLVRQLCEQCDVLIENFRPGQMEKWGLGPAEIKQINPSLIYTRISGYGQTGPYSSYPGFASVCEGFGGFRYVNGEPGEIPVRPNLSLGDTLAGLHAALGVCMAYIRCLQQGQGKGQVVDVSIFESVFNMLEAVVPEYSGVGKVREPSGSTIKGIVPSNTYRCEDEKLIIIGANTKGMFERLMRLVGRDDFADDPRLATNSGRVTHEEAIDKAIADWAATVPLKDALAMLQEQAVAAGPILNVEDMFADPHYQARGAFEEVSVNGEILHIPSIAPRLEETPGRTDRPGPQLGEHTDQIFKALLGLDDKALARLRDLGAI
ncbi:MAG: CoA transferase [Porticoccaceae bacterium]|nr:CoA transferase [Porticoccaceae bacterium]MDG2501553.1 CoA transferase [Porticoccaceae bacterium]